MATTNAAFRGMNRGLGRLFGPTSLRQKLSQNQTISKSLSRTRSFATSEFQPPPKNTYHGSPVYDDIDITSPPTEDMASTRRNADAEAVFVVSGASRGIGLQYVKDLLDRTSGTVVACCRNPDSASALNDFVSSAPPNVASRVKILPLDVTEQSQIDALANELQSQNSGRVDALFNVAGILGDGSSTPGPELNLSKIDRGWFEKQMAVNVIGPMMLTKALAPLMKAKKGRKYLRDAEAVVVNMSARIGSIADNQGGIGWHTYRMSKAALNQGTRTISHELKRQGTWAIALYPGFTDTELSKPFQKGVKKENIFPVDFTVGRLLAVVDGMEERHSGGLYDWAGQAIPF